MKSITKHHQCRCPPVVNHNLYIYTHVHHIQFWAHVYGLMDRSLSRCTCTYILIYKYVRFEPRNRYLYKHIMYICVYACTPRVQNTSRPMVPNIHEYLYMPKTLTIDNNKLWVWADHLDELKTVFVLCVNDPIKVTANKHKTTGSALTRNRQNLLYGKTLAGKLLETSKMSIWHN